MSSVGVIYYAFVFMQYKSIAGPNPTIGTGGMQKGI